MLYNFIKKFRALGGFKKRGVIYIAIALAFMLYEIIFHNPTRTTVLLLWLGVIVIAISVIVSLKEPDS